MVTTLLKSTLREIRQSLGRYLAILAIIGLGVGFFAGLRMSQPSMIATGVVYLDQHALYDFRLMSTLGFTEDDVEAFAGLDGVSTACGSVYAEFLWQKAEDEEVVLLSHALTDGVNRPELMIGRMPEKANECLGDANYFTEADLGKELKVSANNEEDTLDLLVYDEYTLVGLAATPMYLNYERGTAGIGNGNVAAFVLMPRESFDSEAFHEVYLRIEDGADAYSEAYQAQIDELKPRVETLLEQRAALRYDTLHSDAMDEIQDGEQELADGWNDYRAERADAEQELADAYQELTDGEQEYGDGLADYEQGKADYGDGLREYQEALTEISDAEQELADGWKEYEDAKAEVLQELADAYQKLQDGEQDYADGLQEYEDGLAALEEAEAELAEGEQELADARKQLDDADERLSAAEDQLSAAAKQLEEGEESYQQLSGMYQAGQSLVNGLAQQGYPVTSVDQILAATKQDPNLAAQVDGALQAQGGSLSAFEQGWTAAEQQLGAPLNQDSLSAVRNELTQGREEYEDGLHSLDKGVDAYLAGLREYQSGIEELEEARKQLEEAKLELEDAAKQLEEARQELDDGWLDYYEGKAEAEKELADAEQELRDGEQEIADAKAELTDAKAELDDAKRDLDSAPGELADARAELDDGWAEYYDGLAEAEQEFADAEEELRDGEQEIADAYVELADLKEADTYTLTRKENNGYACFDNDTSIIAAISVVFPVFFFLVAALVCMTTMKRMVDEQRTQIGVLKALGYSRGQIIGKYLFYSGSAAMVGCVLGYAVGSRGLPLVIWEIYGIMYGFAPLEFVFDPILAAVSFAAALLCSMGATYLSCYVELAKPAAELIRPKAPKAGKRVFLEYITPLWKRMSFLRKVSIRNVLRYRSRLVMMVLGIGGCTALLVTGFGIRDSIANIADDQYEKITLYDYAVNFQEPKTQEQADSFLTGLGWEPDMGILVHSGSTDAFSDTDSRSTYLVVPADNSVDGFMSLHSGEREIAFPGVGEVVLNVGLAEDLAVTVGDKISLRDDDLGTIEVTVADICDNYIFNYVFVSPETYQQQQLSDAPDFKTLFVLSHPEADPYEEGVRLAEGDGISNVTVNAADRTRVSGMLSRMDILIVVVVVCAAALAFIVLYNLTNINITERIREIATIKVLGFYHSEVAAYVFREITMLSTVGSLVGLLLGKALHAFVMAQVQVDGMFFPCQIKVPSYIISFVLTMLFAVLITRSMRPRLRKIDMAESLKSIE